MIERLLNRTPKMAGSISPGDLPDFTERDLEVVPVERADTIPSSWYTDPRFHELDRLCLFGTTWQGIGHASQVAQPGSHFVAEVAGNPIIVVRGKDNVLRAFYNVCRHRGGPLATGDGCAKVLQCQYHGWTYTLEGQLRGVPKFNRVELFDQNAFGLIQVAVDSWEDLIFVNLAAQPEPLERTLGGIRERIAPLTPKEMRLERRVDYEIECNWKVYIDNFLEGYHIPFVHPELCKIYDYQQYDTETTESYSLQSAPLTSDENVYTDGGGEAFYYFVFPNFMMNIVPGRLQTNLVVPIRNDRCRVIFWYYYTDVTSSESRRRIEADVEFSDHVQQEDIEICEHVQKGLGSVAYDRGRFSVEQERGVHHFQTLLKSQYRRWAEKGRAATASAG